MEKRHKLEGHGLMKLEHVRKHFQQSVLGHRRDTDLDADDAPDSDHDNDSDHDHDPDMDHDADADLDHAPDGLTKQPQFA